MRLHHFWVMALALACALPARAEPKLTRLPRLQTFVEATYPPAEQAAGREATVLLAIEIGADGKVTHVSVARSGGADFDAAAVAAAARFVFQPAEVDGVPAPVKITYRYAFVIKHETVKAAPQVNFEGVVLDRFKKTPIAGVAVKVTDLGRKTVTGADGRFAFVDLPIGTHRIELSAPKLITVSTEETLAEGRKRTVRYLVEPKLGGVDEEEVVRAPRIKKESVETTIRTEEARRVPGTEGDTLKVVQNLPGVARAQLGSGQLIVWGAAPADTRVDVDGVEVPALYHVGGLRSTVNGELVRSVELLPGAYGADYGRGLGGLVRVDTRPLPERGVHGYVAADVLDASAMISAAIGKRLRVAVAARYSYLDKLLGGIISPKVNDYFPIPRYDDYQAKATLALRRGEELSALFLASDDHLRRSLPSSDPAEVRADETNGSWYRLMLRYTRLLPDGASVVATPFFGYDTSRQSTRFGGSPTELDLDSWRYGLRASYRRRLARPFTLSVGVDLQGTRTHVARSGSITLPPREGDLYVFGQAPGDDVAADSFSTHIVDAAPFVFGELRLGPVTITPGLRLDAFLIAGDHLSPDASGTPAIGFQRLAWALDPRLTVSWRAHRRLTLTAAVGLFHQAPDPVDLSAVFGNPTLGLERALHLTLGAAVHLTGTLTAEVVGFYKQLDGLVTRSPLPSPELARALTQDGIGRSYGGQLLLRQELWRGLFGWVSYSLSRSERRDHPGLPWRLFDYDQTHVLAVVASYEVRGWTFGARFRLSTGFPRTPVTGSYYDARDDRYQPIFGQQNSIRIPTFYQLDLRIDRRFVWSRVALDLFLDVQNVTYQRNPEEVVYSEDFAQRGYITGLPTLAVLGVRVEW
ncbi:MAG TPA: TonB family protein [Polyangia bacterium]